MLILTFSHIEQWNKQQSVCQTQDSLWHCFYKQGLSVIELNNIEAFSILAAATLFLLESRERRRNTIYEAWQVIEALLNRGIISLNFQRFINGFKG